MKHTLKGSINYELEFDTQTYEVGINYTTSMQNDMASIAITQMIFHHAEVHNRKQKESVRGLDKENVKRKKTLATTINYISRGKAGAARVLGMLIDNWEDYQKNLGDKQAQVEQFIKDNDVKLTESGKLSEEEANKLVEKMKLDKVDSKSSPVVGETLTEQNLCDTINEVGKLLDDNSKNLTNL